MRVTQINRSWINTMENSAFPVQTKPVFSEIFHPKYFSNFDIFLITQIFIKIDPRLKNGTVPPFFDMKGFFQQRGDGDGHPPAHSYRGEGVCLFIFKQIQPIFPPNLTGKISIANDYNTAKYITFFMANSHKITILAIHRTNFGAVLLRQPVKQKPENETRLTELNRSWIGTV